MLLFGASQGEQDDPNERRVSPDRRIVLPPAAAKRLSVHPGDVIRDYESKFVPLDAKAAVYERLKPTPPLSALSNFWPKGSW